jgi:hypothetical protein
MITPKEKALEFFQKYGKEAMNFFIQMKDLFEKTNAVFLVDYWDDVEKELNIIIK